MIDKLGADTFSEKAIELVSQDGVATGVPSDGWGQLLIYRKDVFDKAGLDAPATLDDVTGAAEQLNGKDDMAASRSPPRRATASRPRPSSTWRSPRAARSSTTPAR